MIKAFFNKLFSKKIIKYILVFEPTIYNWPYNFYETYEHAEKKLREMTQNEGKVIKVTIHIDK